MCGAIVSILHSIKNGRPNQSNDKTGPAFDIQIVRRGIPSKVLKRTYLMSRKVRKRREDRYPGIFENKSHKPIKHTKSDVATSRVKPIRWCHPVFWKLGGNDHE